MLIISSKLPTKNLLIYKSLAKLIQGFIYHQLPASEHEGYRHKSGKIFKKTNFDFFLKEDFLQVRFSSLIPKYEELMALNILKEGFILGKIHLIDTTVSFKNHLIQKNEAKIKGYIACATKGILGHKIYLEPQDDRFDNMLKNNILQRYECLFQKQYLDEFELKLLNQTINKPKYFYYGNNNSPVVAHKASWHIKASPDLINLILSTGAGSGCMNFGVGFLEEI